MLRAKRIPAIAVLGLIGSSATLATLVLVGPARTVFFLSQSRLFVLLPVAGLVFGALSMGAVILGLNALLGARARSTQSGHDRHARYGLLLGALGTLPVCLSVWVVAGAGDPLLESLAAHDDDLIVALREIADDMEVDSEGEVVSLTLWNSGTTDDALSHLKRLEKLEVLALNSSGITDQGVKHLLSNVRLRHLTFGDNQNQRSKPRLHRPALEPRVVVAESRLGALRRGGDYGRRGATSDWPEQPTPAGLARYPSQ